MNKKTRDFLFKLIAVIFCCFLYLIFLAKTIGVNAENIIINNPLARYLLLSMALFSIGMFGLLNSKNLIKILISIELVFNAINISLIAWGHYVDLSHLRGQVFSLFIIAIGAVEIALGLAIVILIQSQRKTNQVSELNELNG